LAATVNEPHRDDALVPPHTRVALPEKDGGFEIFNIEGDGFSAYAASLVALISQGLLERGSVVPEIALQEVVDNLVHALPCSVSVVVDAGSGNVFLSDTGRGISRLDLAFQLGYSTASEAHRSYIRGVGIGLHLAREDVRSLGGELLLESEPGVGTFVQLCLSGAMQPQAWGGAVATPHLTQRQNNILFLLSEGESLGPSQVSSELNIGVSTAHRDLVKLQDFGLIYINKAGKRFLSESGRSYLQSLLSL
jgi:anti-sigma regulatory factor (Ser/Thr protein kinase)